MAADRYVGRVCPDRTRHAGSGPLELPVQLLAGEDQGRGPAVRAVMGVLGQVPLREQGGDLLAASADRRP